MSIETSSNPVGVTEEVTIPSLRTFQNLNASDAGLTDNINLFRGNVSFQLPLLTLENRGGLKADVLLSYDSEVQVDVSTRNLESPTGIVGLGWSLPYEMIVLDVRGSVSEYDDAYYLAATDGSRSQLFLTNRTPTQWTFESENEDFSRIVYLPEQQVWRITTTDGLVRSYGADVQAGQDPKALRMAIKWGGTQGNWTDSSVQGGQSTFPISWNLASVQNAWGDRIIFSYSRFPDDQVRIGGPDGLTYSRASYLTGIRDPSGRTVNFHYADKINTPTIAEYQKPHQNPTSNVEAFQDRYETRFLDSVTVLQHVAQSPVEVVTLRLHYSVERLADPATPGPSSTLYKRYLRGLTTVNGTGKLLPGMRFDYYTGTETTSGPVHRGALKNITFPSGGTVAYDYRAQPLQGTALDLTLQRTDPDWVPGIPRAWFGPDAVVVTHYDAADGQRLTVSVYDWNGRWLASRPLSQQLDYGLDLSTLDVSFQDDFFLVSGMTGGAGTNGQLVAWAVTPAFGRYGDWDAVALDTPDVLSQDNSYQAVTGRAFVALAVAGQSDIARYTWNPRDRIWVRDDLLLSTSTDGQWTLGANENVLTVCQYQPGMPLTLTLHYLDPVTRDWNDSLAPLDSIPQYVWSKELPKLSFSLSSTFVTATYLTAEDESRNTVDYTVRVYPWDRDFNPLPQPPAIVATGVPADTKEPVFQSSATGSLVGNVGNLLRFNGDQWQRGIFGDFNEGTDVARFAYSGDLAVGVSSDKSAIAAYDPYGDQFVTIIPAGGTQGPASPTLNGRLVTVRNRIYEQQPTGELLLLDQQLPLDSVYVANQAPYFLAYGMPDGTSYAWLMKNGVLAQDATRLTGRVYVPDDAAGPGTELVGPSSFMTWVGASFDEPDSLTLHRVLNQQTGGQVPTFVVASVESVDGLGVPVQAAFDYNVPGSVGTCGPYGLASQFSMVKAALGTNQTTSCPEGSSVYQYQDGLTPQGDSTTTPYSLLNGLLKQVSGYDSAGHEVARTVREWEVVRTVIDAATGASRKLLGAYVRQKQTADTVFDVNPMGASAQPPLTRVTATAYNEANGQVRSVVSTNYNPATGRDETVTESSIYAYEKYPAFATPAVNLLAPRAQRTVTVDEAIVLIDATTWTQVGAHQAPAAFRNFLALDAGATLSPSDWANTTRPSASSWKRRWEVTQRDLRGEIQEYIAEDGLTNAKLLDTTQELVVATFGNASLVAGQVAYQGFESYEDLTGWTLAGSAQTLNSAIASGDSFTGLRSVGLPGTQAASPLARTLTVTETAGQRYIVSCWLKTPTGFDTGPGGASCYVTGASGPLANVAIPDTGGVWTSFYVLFDLPADNTPQTLTLSFSNTRGKELRIDNIRFSPFAATFTGSVYNAVHLVEDAQVLDMGAMRRRVLGDFQETDLTVDALEAVVLMKGAYLSRRGNQGAFSADAPNCLITLKPRGLAVYESFNVGDVFAGTWTSEVPAAWTTSGGALRHIASHQQASIHYTGFPEPTEGLPDRFGVSVRVHPDGLLTSQVGMLLGPALQLLWQPSQATWALQENGGTVATAPVRSLLDVASSFTGTLDAGTLPPEFLNLFPLAGLPLAPASTVAVVLSGQAWCVSDAASRTRYYLVAGNGSVQVTAFPQQWLVLVQDQQLALITDGGLALTHACTEVPSRDIALVATDGVAFDQACFITDPDTQLSYLDGGGRLNQEQVVLDSGLLATATIHDTVGRDAIRTQGAVLTPTSAAWGAYRQDLATFDWSTLTISGLVKTQNPASGAFPYTRSRYESSPLGREVERGVPGEAYAIPTSISTPAHTARWEYGLNDGSLGVTAGKLARTTAITPDGITSISMVDQRGSSILTAVRSSAASAPAVWQVTRNVYDAAGRCTSTTMPMGWTDTFSSDFIGQPLTEVRANAGTTRSMYDARGRLRFQQDARGAAATTPYIRYWKYDVKSRVVEEGCAPSDWPGTLAQHVEDPSFPQATASNLYTYDLVSPTLTPDNLFSLGQLVKAVSQNEVDPAVAGSDSFTATEILTHDIYITVTEYSVQVPGDATPQVTYYTYDNQGDVAAIDYPGTDGVSLGYQRDVAGRVARILVNDQRIAAYTYGANGGIATEALYSDAGQQVGVTRTFSYAPPGWLQQTQGSQFSETTDYALPPGGGAGWYGGMPSRITTAARGPRPERVSNFGMDPRGWLSSVDASDGQGAQPYSYDANGNLTKQADITQTYTQATQDRAQSLTAPPEAVTFGYDANGNQTTLSDTTGGSGGSTSTWDGFRDRVLETRMGNGTRVDVRYGRDSRRIQKTVTQATGQSVAKLYLRGAGNDVLVEVSGSSSVQYIWGPRGPVQLRTGSLRAFIVTDRLGSIRAVLDEQANLIAGYDYLPYGDTAGGALGPQPDIIPYRFVARELDETGDYDFRARMYSPRQGRMRSTDPRHQFSSPYAYAGNNPLMYIDPDGEFVVELITAIGLAIAAAAAEVAAAAAAAAAATAAAIVEVAPAIAIGAGLGAVAGIVNGAVSVASSGAKGSEAAGIFFGTLAISTVGGALGGGLTGGVAIAAQSLITNATLATATTIAVGAVVEGGVASAQGSAQAALMGADPATAAWQSFITGTIGSAVGGSVSGILKKPLSTPSLKGTLQATIRGVSGGVAGGLASASVDAALTKSDATSTLTGFIQGVAFGALNGLVPEVINYKIEKHSQARNVQTTIINDDSGL
ncbi:RHS repeat-associated core domain-containing protein [Corallococcus sp. bb12-1]|uniref:RHS repeat domain-containing protein n=1 Tax=Corallococcus sp. bb12-1 TaxID=2996784 RepID=UPI00226FF897|nr:RHS repeat-associated core domain-containing protein [Corallococcus sp. bb12-1]MCY1042096.1 RHS repeat-associated core domain-containing protein [Corallococcus sp. bb12-1]